MPRNNKRKETILSKHILELQADKGKLTDRCRELEQQLDKAKELLRMFLDAKNIEETCVAESEADKFLNSEVEQ